MKPSSRARLRQRGYAAILTVAVIIIAVAINLLADAADRRWALKLDLTEGGLTNLSEESVEAVRRIDADATIYLLYRAGTNSEQRSTLTALSERYRALNPRIQIQVVDPVAQPGLVNRIKGSENTLSEGWVVVTNADLSRIKVVPSSDMYSYTYDESTGSYAVSAFDGEAALTSALVYVTGTDAPRVLFLTGHNELGQDYCATLTAQLNRENYEVRSFELGGREELRPDDTLMVLAPSLDLTDSELSALRAFFGAGGRAFFVNDPSIDQAKLPNYSKLMSEIGLGYIDGVVVEDASSTGNYLSSQLYLVPNADVEHAVTAALAGTRLILPGACAVAAVSNDKYAVTPLLTTSATAFLKPTDEEGDLYTPAETDERGPFTLAAATESADQGGARAVAVGNLYVVLDSDYMYSSGNLNFTLSAVKWLTNWETGVHVRSKTLRANVLSIPDARTLWLLAMLVVALVPGAILVAGTIMYARRRRL